MKKELLVLILLIVFIILISGCAQEQITNEETGLPPTKQKESSTKEISPKEISKEGIIPRVEETVKECIAINKKDKKEIGGIGVLCDEKQDCFDFLEDRVAERGESLSPEALKYDYKCVKTSFEPILAAVADLPENGEQVLCNAKNDCNFLGRYLGLPDVEKLTAIKCEDDICMATKGIYKQPIGFVPMTCIIAQGIYCDNFKVDASDKSVQLILINREAFDLSNIIVTVGDCITYKDHGIWTADTILGGADGITLTECINVSVAGRRNYLANILVTYKSSFGEEYSKVGGIIARVEP